jgi:dsRNA-specific ribonuclease
VDPPTRRYTVAAIVGSRSLAVGHGPNRKLASAEAATEALRIVRLELGVD